MLQISVQSLLAGLNAACKEFIIYAILVPDLYRMCQDGKKHFGFYWNKTIYTNAATKKTIIFIFLLNVNENMYFIFIMLYLS